MCEVIDRACSEFNKLPPQFVALRIRALNKILERSLLVEIHPLGTFHNSQLKMERGELLLEINDSSGTRIGPVSTEAVRKIQPTPGKESAACIHLKTCFQRRS